MKCPLCEGNGLLSSKIKIQSGGITEILRNFFGPPQNIGEQILDAFLGMVDAYDIGQSASSTSAIGKSRAVLRKLKEL